MSEITVTKSNFESEVLKSNIPVLVDFWAIWCGPCKMLSPIVSEIAEEYDGKIKVGKVNVDEEQELAMQFKIASIPTLILFENGRIKNTLIGYHTKDQLKQSLEI